MYYAIHLPAWLILLALVLDLALGDPAWLPHPVRIIGAAIARGEDWLRSGDARDDLRNGTLLAVCVIGASALTVFVVIAALSAVSSWLAAIGALIISSTTLAPRGLDRAAFEVQRALAAGDEGRARRALPALVGRDPSRLDCAGMIRAAVESVAENCSDGVIAPLFFLFIGGPVAAIAYKAVNTLDSMIGYTNERYYYFGRAAARIDDVSNYLPARLTALCLIGASALVSRRARKAARACLNTARLHHSPNAGYPEATMAGALGIQLGGDAVYGGELVQRGRMGAAERQPVVADVGRARGLMWLASVLALVILALARLLIAG